MTLQGLAANVLVAVLVDRQEDASQRDKDVHASHCNAAKDDGTILRCQTANLSIKKYLRII